MVGNKWVGPFRVVKRFGVNYRIVSKGGKVTHKGEFSLQSSLPATLLLHVFSL